ncbi:hypothetical protein BD769DRAFT_1683052 [Suillus cothurnatus]|nr:hypothetical protein BD769DRAFT_1683052 [Suillus cothurnatus]
MTDNMNMNDNVNDNVNDNGNGTNTNTTTAEVDIFAPPPPVVEDEKAIALKREVNELRGRLQAMVEVAPVADDKTLLEKEEWCQQWKDLIDSLTTCMQVAHQIKVHIHLTDAERQNGQSGNKIRDTLQGQVSAMKEPTAMQADQDARSNNLQAEQERQAQAEKDGAATVQDHTQEGDEGHEENTESNDGREDHTEANDGQEDHARADVPQADEDGNQQQQLTPSVPSDSDAPKPAEAVVVNPKIIIVCKNPNPKKIIANAVPCTKCVRIGRTCYPTSVGNVCKDCKRLKVKCSLASDKNKGKEQPTPTPPSKATAAKPRPRPITRQKAELPRKAAAPVSAAKPQGQAKEKDEPTAGPAPQRTAPGPSRALRPYVEIKVARKRKHVEVEEESSESESEGDDEDEDAYMAGRLNGLNTFVNMFETAFGALKKEVAEIDSYLGRKRRRHHK